MDQEFPQKCFVRLDRVQLVSEAAPGQKPPEIPGFEIVSDHFVRPQTSVQTYARCRQYNSSADGTQIFWQYDRRKGWLSPWKITLVADDRLGLSRREICNVLTHCRDHRFLLVELAFDFVQPSSVGERFVLRHGMFGKSKCREGRS
jgi:hypothetical protein